MNRFLLLALAAFIGITVSAKSEIQVKDYTVDEFTQLVVNGPLRVELTQSDSHSVSIESDAVDKVNVQCVGGVLLLSVNSKGSVRYNIFKAKVSVKTLDKLTLANAAVLNAADDIHAADMVITAKSASTIYFHPQCRSLDVKAEDASKVVLTGSADTFTLRCTESSDCQAQFMKTSNADVYCDGSSQAVVNTDTLSAEAHSASKVAYVGNPLITKQETSSASLLTAQ